MEGSKLIADSRDRVLLANHEQGIRSSIELKHIAAIIIKSRPKKAKEGEEQYKEFLKKEKNQFVEYLQKTKMNSQLPPKDIRMKIELEKTQDQKVETYKNWKQVDGENSLYKVLKDGLNKNLQRGQEEIEPEKIIFAFDANTDRSKILSLIGINQEKLMDPTFCRK